MMFYSSIFIRCHMAVVLTRSTNLAKSPNAICGASCGGTVCPSGSYPTVNLRIDQC